MTAPLIDPKDLFTSVLGAVLGVGIVVFFILLALAMDMTTIVNHANIPMQ